jgi:hypothetical protein
MRQRANRLEQRLDRRVGADLHADGIANPAAELDVRAVERAGADADPR